MNAGRRGSPCQESGARLEKERAYRRGKTHSPSREKRLSLEKKRAWALPGLVGALEIPTVTTIESVVSLPIKPVSHLFDPFFARSASSRAGRG
jgi:hypothetical protein